MLAFLISLVWAGEDLRTPPHPERINPPSCGEGFEGDLVAEGLELKGESPGSCGEGFEGDLVAEGLELGDGSLAGTVGVAADEVVATQVLVVTVIGE